MKYEFHKLALLSIGHSILQLATCLKFIYPQLISWHFLRSSSDFLFRLSSQDTLSCFDSFSIKLNFFFCTFTRETSSCLFLLNIFRARRITQSRSYKWLSCYSMTRVPTAHLIFHFEMGRKSLFADLNMHFLNEAWMCALQHVWVDILMREKCLIAYMTTECWRHTID